MRPGRVTFDKDDLKEAADGACRLWSHNRLAATLAAADRVGTGGDGSAGPGSGEYLVSYGKARGGFSAIIQDKSRGLDTLPRPRAKARDVSDCAAPYELSIPAHRDRN
jgi:hypothetical protein